MSNVEGSQSESLGEVTRHLAGAIGVDPSESNNTVAGVGMYSHVEGNGGLSASNDVEVGTPESNIGYDRQEYNDEPQACCEETCRDESEGPVATLSRNNYDISIETKNYGYIVRVGCQTFAIEKPETIGNMITKFLSNPLEAEREWYNSSGQNRLEDTLSKF